MEPLQIAAAAFALASGIVVTTTIIAEVSAELHDASDDIEAIGKELQALQSLLGPLSNGLARFDSDSNKNDGTENVDGGASDIGAGGNKKGAKQSYASLLGQVEQTLAGALDVVKRIETTLRKFKGKNSLWVKFKWAIYSSGQIRKLRLSLESYKVALGIGLHVMTMSIVGEIKDDTEVIREVAEVMKLLQTDDDLARLDTREKPSETQNKVQHWLNKMADYTSYAETAYQATTIDPEDEAGKWGTLASTTSDLPKGRLAEIQETASMMELASDTASSDGLSVEVPSDYPWTSSRSSVAVAESSVDRSISTKPTIYRDLGSLPGSSSEVVLQSSSIKVEGTNKPPTYASPEQKEVEVMVENDLKAVDIDWSPLVPKFLPTAEFDKLASFVRVDKPAIEKARAAREKLSPESRKRLDVKFLGAIAGSDGRSTQKRPVRCESLLDRGAALSPELASSALIQVIDQQDHRTLSTLLRYGIDPNSLGPGGRDPRLPLALAASTDLKCLCALILAGAKIKDTERPHVCTMFCQSGTQVRSIRIFCSPLLAAFAAIRPQGRRSIDISQFWVSHFLLVNGADVNTRTCTSLMELVVRHWPLASQYRITNHLLSFSVNLDSSDVELQFRYAMEVGSVRLAKLLLDNGVSAGQIARGGSAAQDPLVVAVEATRWDCVDLVLGYEEVNHIHLFGLVHVYMCASSSKMTQESFKRVLGAVLAKGVSIQAKESWRYPRQPEDGNYTFDDAEEVVSVSELAKNILNRNKRDRGEMVELLCKDD